MLSFRTDIVLVWDRSFLAKNCLIEEGSRNIKEPSNCSESASAYFLASLNREQKVYT